MMVQIIAQITITISAKILALSHLLWVRILCPDENLTEISWASAADRWMRDDSGITYEM